MRYRHIAGLIAGLCLITASSGSLPSKLGKLVIDTDAGGDDAAAILLAIAAQKLLKNDGFEIVAITCTYGNTNVTNVGTNVLKILTIANASHIPVYLGAHKSMMKHFTQGSYFGEDGFGDFNFDQDILGTIDRSKHASVSMVDLAREHAGNLSIMILGPLTNVALAVTLDPKFVDNVKQFYILGSSVRGMGNIGPNVEFNFYQDPPSNFIVLNNTRGQQALLFPWETSLFASIPMAWRKNTLGALRSKTMKYLNKIEKTILSESTWNVADLMLSALVFWPNLIKNTRVTNVTPVYSGPADGSVLVDYTNVTGKPQNVQIIETFDVDGFQKLLLEIFAQD